MFVTIKMLEVQKINYKKVRQAIPNLIQYTGDHHNVIPDIQLYTYDNGSLSIQNNVKVDQLSKLTSNALNNWLNLHGLHDLELIKSIGNQFDLNDFILSDIVNVSKRSKVEEFNGTLFFNIKSVLPIDGELIKTEQISFILKEGLLFSFQEKKSDYFSHIRERLKLSAGIVRTKKVDYLLYLLLDGVIENFYLTIENEENKVDEAIDVIKTKSSPQILSNLETIRDNLFYLKKSILPLRDSLHSIKSTKDDVVFNEIAAENYTFFDRLYQKSLELLEQIDSDIATVESASQFYFSMQGHKMNEVMKTLTFVSVFFMPMTFLTGLYGMNFDFLPGSHEKYGFYVLLISMFILVIIMLIYFKRRKWF